MIIKGKDVIGLNIITVDNGKVVETVDDIAFNPNTHRVEALLVSSGGLFSSAKAIHMDNVRNIGEDAVIVPDASVIVSIKELGEEVHSIADSNKHLVKTNVVTVDGKELGKVTDIFFDSATGMVDSMEVSQGSLKKLTEGNKSIKPSDIVTIGADATIVSAYTEAKLEAQGESGGLKGAINSTKDKAAEITANTTEAVQDAATKTKEMVVEKSQDAKRVIDEKAGEAKQKADELSDDVARKGREVRDDLDRKSDELKDASQDATAKARVKAEELADEAKQKSEELRDVADKKAQEAKVKVDELSVEAKERMKDVKDQHGDKGRTVRSKGREVAAQAEKAVERTKTRVKSK